jgi:glycosyltransferase involved in cell wall biosynthesis
MVDAVAALDRPVPLIVVGPVGDELAMQMMERSARRGVDLGLLGPLPHHAAMEMVAGASVGLSLLSDLPNYRWSMPTKVIEYLAMGVPVVASDLPGTRDAVRGMDAVVLAAPDDPEAAAHGIARAMACRGAAAVQSSRVREDCVWPTDEVLALYRATARP